jgi:hypothetical protein
VVELRVEPAIEAGGGGCVLRRWWDEEYECREDPDMDAGAGGLPSPDRETILSDVVNKTVAYICDVEPAQPNCFNPSKENAP